MTTDVETTRLKARDAALDTMEAIRKRADPPGTCVLSNGIVLKITAPPQNMIRQAALRVPEPPVPTFFNEGKGREEPNPGSDVYKAAVEEWKIAQYLATGDVALLMGTSCLSVPDGMYRPEEDGWIEYLRLLGMADVVAPDDGPERRYWAWIRYYALRTDDDISAATYAPLMLNNLSEEDVAMAIAAFRGRARWGTDPEGAPGEVKHPDGDRSEDGVPGAGARVRGARRGKVRRGAVAPVASAVA